MAWSTHRQHQAEPWVTCGNSQTTSMLVESGMCFLALNIDEDSESAGQPPIIPAIMPLPIAAIIAAHWSIISSAPGI